MKTLFASLLALSIGMPVMANPDDDIMARQALMKQVGAAAKARDLVALADAGEKALAAFRVDTTGQGTVETKAAANIWTDWAGFEALLNTMVTAARAGDGDAAFGTCRTCHTTYRN
ncbi:MAG: hypothetical protein AAGJ34_02140 [Pseudomonadota bacterium]